MANEPEELIGIVTQIPQKDGVPTGIRLDGRDTWFNYTKPEYRKGVWYEPKKGDRVKITCVESNGKFWVQAITLEEESPQSAQEDGPKWSFADKDRLIAKECALKAAVEFYATRAGTPADVLIAAHEFYEGFLADVRVTIAMNLPVAASSPNRSDIPFAGNEDPGYRA